MIQEGFFIRLNSLKIYIDSFRLWALGLRLNNGNDLLYTGPSREYPGIHFVFRSIHPE